MIFTPVIAGKKLPELTNPGTAADLLAGKQLIGQDGNPLTGTMPSLAAQAIMPRTYDQVIQAGQYLGGDQTIKGDANLLAENIKEGASIFGVPGAHPVIKIKSLRDIATFTPTSGGGVLTIAQNMSRLLGVFCVVWKSGTGQGCALYTHEEDSGSSVSYFCYDAYTSNPGASVQYNDAETIITYSAMPTSVSLASHTIHDGFVVYAE